MINRRTVKLNFARKALLAMAGIMTISLAILSGSADVPGPIGPRDAPAARLEFELASIKSKGDLGLGTGRVRTLPDGRLRAEDARLLYLIQWAYGLTSSRYRISGIPDWIYSASYDIEAKAKAADNATREQVMLMLESLLEERFKLKVRWETKIIPVSYVLTVASSGLKLQQSTEGSCFTPDPNVPRVPLRSPGPGRPAVPPCGRPTVMISESRARVIAGKTSMAELTFTLSNMLGRTVIDQTGFTGTFDAHLTFTRDEALAGTVPRPPSALLADGGVPVFTAIQEQLGLNLESVPGAVEVLVIESVEKPTQN